MTAPQQFHKKPIVIEAMQLGETPEEAFKLLEWINEVDPQAASDGIVRLRGRGPDTVKGLDIATAEGVMTADPGDWVIREPNPTADRRFYPCKPDIFEATYTPATEAWTPYDSDHKDANPLPRAGDLVWIHDEFYDGVTIGTWNGGWWRNAEGSDDVGVTHWAPLEKPAAP